MLDDTSPSAGGSAYGTLEAAIAAMQRGEPGAIRAVNTLGARLFDMGAQTSSGLPRLSCQEVVALAADWRADAKLQAEFGQFQNYVKHKRAAAAGRGQPLSPTPPAAPQATAVAATKPAPPQATAVAATKPAAPKTFDLQLLEEWGASLALREKYGCVFNQFRQLREREEVKRRGLRSAAQLYEKVDVKAAVQRAEQGQGSSGLAADRQTIEQLAAEWRADPSIRAEFTSFESFSAYRRAEAAGRTRRYGRK